MFNNKGISGLGWISIGLGLLMIAKGAITALNTFKIISFKMPAIPTLIFSVMLIIGAILLFIESNDINSDPVKYSAIILGILAIIWGALPVVAMFVTLPFTGLLTAIAPGLDYFMILVGSIMVIGGFSTM